MRNTPPVGPYSSPVPRDLSWSWGGGLFIMSEVSHSGLYIDPRGGSHFEAERLQGYLAHKKTPTPLGHP